MPVALTQKMVENLVPQIAACGSDTLRALRFEVYKEIHRRVNATLTAEKVFNTLNPAELARVELILLTQRSISLTTAVESAATKVTNECFKGYVVREDVAQLVASILNDNIKSLMG